MHEKKSEFRAFNGHIINQQKILTNMQTIKLKRGLDIPFEGQAAETLGSVYSRRRVCISAA